MVVSSRARLPSCSLALSCLLLAGCIPANQRPGRSPAQPEPASATSPATGEVALPPAAKVAPTWMMQRVRPDAVEVKPSTYVVRPGDSLRLISERTGAGSEAIARENGIRPPFTIRTGQRLRIPGGRWHRVKAGETGIAIALAYGVDWSEVTAANHLEEPYILRTGQRLLLPSKQDVATRSLEQRAQAFRIDIEDLITGAEPALAANATAVAPVAAPTRKLPATATVGEPAQFTGRFDWPLTGPILARFGPAGSGRRNDGINIGADEGAAVLAAADGVVAYAGELGGYGGLVLIRHGDGWVTAYGHAEALLVTRGQAVKRGQPIARAGETGSAGEPQLHFEIRRGKKPVDPLAELPRRG